MDYAANECDVFQKMKQFNFNKPIKVVYTFEDDSNETNAAKKLQLPIDPVGYTSSQHATGKDLMTTPLLNQLCNRNKNCEDIYNGIYMESEKFHGIIRNPPNSYSHGNPNHHSSKENIDNMANISILNTNHLTSIENEYYISLLDSVSENLILFAKCFHYYNSIHITSPAAREAYIAEKTHYFNQSYCTVLSLLLPHEHNHEFIRNFITRTIEIAKRKSLHYQITFNTLQNHFYGLIQWTKQRKRHLEAKSKQLYQTNDRSPPVLPVPTVHASNNTYSVNAQQPISRQIPVLLSSNDLNRRPPSYSHHMSQQADALSQGSQVITECKWNNNSALYQTYHNKNQPLLPTPKVTSVSISKNITNVKARRSKKRPASLVLPPKSSSKTRSKIQLINSQLISETNSRMNVEQRIHNSLLPPAPSNKFNVKKQVFETIPVQPILINANINKNSNAEDNGRTVCLFSSGEPGNKISISIDRAVAETVIREKSCKTSNSQAENPAVTPTILSNCTCLPSHNSSQSIQNSKNQTSSFNSEYINTAMKINNYNRLETGEKQNYKANDVKNRQEPMRVRSVSRDSGFGSPVLTALLSNDCNTLHQNYTDNQEISRESTRVTSMNPNVLFNRRGMCKVCGSTTTFMCLGCSKDYYCGRVCQEIDWPDHRQECHKI